MQSRLQALIAAYDRLERVLPAVGLTGKMIGAYRVEQRIGRGGMGNVYRAIDTRLDRQVALKTLPAQWFRDPEWIARLRREAKALARIDHPNTVTLFSVEEVDGVHFLTMAYVDGDTLEDLIPTGGLEPNRFFELAIPIVDALRAAHGQGVIHRDLKPTNVMVDREGRLRVLDFGLAKLADESMGQKQSGAVVGTFPFMSPEQAEGRAVDARSDIFSLGVVLFRMATGRQPFAGDTAEGIVSAILHDEPDLVHELSTRFRPQLSTIITKCLQKDVAARYSSVGEVHRDLRLVAQSRGTNARRGSKTSAQKRSSKRWRAVAVTALVLTATLEVGRRAVASRFMVSASQSATPSAESRSSPVVAVLPFTATDSTDGGLLARGLHASLLVRLGKLNAFRVISRTSMLEYADHQKSAPQIAKELGASYLLEAQVQAIGERVRIAVQLIDGSEDRPLWGELYDRDLTATALFDVQAELAETMAKQLRVELNPSDRAQLDGIPTKNIDAYRAYVRGLEAMDGAQGGKAARLAFGEAVAHDPDFGRAWAYRSITLSRKFNASGGLGGSALGDRVRLRSEASRALDHARRLSPKDPATTLAWAVYLDYVLKEYQRAVDVIESLEQRVRVGERVLRRKALALSRLGRPAEAVSALQKAVSVNPRSVSTLVTLISQSVFAKDCRTAADAVRRAFDLKPDNVAVFGMTAFFEASCHDSTDRLKAHLATAPSSKAPWGLVVQAQFWTIARDYDRAISVVRRALPEASPALWMTLAQEEAAALQVAGRYEELNERLAEMEARLPQLDSRLRFSEYWHFRYFGFRRNPLQTQRWVERAKRRVIDEWRGDPSSGPYGHLSYSIALLNAGSTTEALDELAKELENPGGFSFRFVDKLAFFDSIRSHPDFLALRRRYSD